ILRVPPDRLRVLDADLTVQNEFTAGEGAWEISPDGLLVVFADKFNLSVVGLNGRSVHRERAVPGAEGGFDHFQFSAAQQFLWTIRHAGKRLIELPLRETANWHVLRCATFPEPAPPASVSLHPHPEGRVIAVWAACGQDGQWVYWAYDDGREIQIYEV